MFKKFLNHESKTIGVGALMVAIFYGINGLIALLRNGLLANRFGASQELDVYYTAFRIPDFLYAILIAGALSAAFIPLFAEKLKTSQNTAWKFANNILSSFSIILAGGAIIAGIFAPALAKLIAPGFTGNAQQEVGLLIRIMMIQPVILGLSQIIGGVLQNFRRFLITSLAPVFYNLGIIIGILFLVPAFGLKGLAWGVVLGAILHFIVQLPTLKSLGFSFRFLPDFKSPDFRAVLRMMGPRVLSLVSVQINFLVVTIIASGLAVGSMAIFNFTNELQNLPQNIFAVSFALAAFPVLASLANEKNKFAQETKNTIKNILFFIIPISVLFFVLRENIIELALGYGRFNMSNIKIASQTLGIFSLAIIAQSLLPLLVRAMFSLKDSLRPFIAGVSANIANIVLGIILANSFGIFGLAIAFVISAWINLIIIGIFLRKKLGQKFFGKDGVSSLMRILVGSLIAGILAWLGGGMLGRWLFSNIGIVGLLSRTILAVILAGGGYIVFLKIIKAPEISFLDRFLNKFR